MARADAGQDWLDAERGGRQPASCAATWPARRPGQDCGLMGTPSYPHCPGHGPAESEGSSSHASPQFVTRKQARRGWATFTERSDSRTGAPLPWDVWPPLVTGSPKAVASRPAQPDPQVSETAGRGARVHPPAFGARM